MKFSSCLFTSRKISLALASFLSLASVATAEVPYASTNPFERSTFGNDWGVLSNDIFFGGVDALFGLSPASRTLLLSATSDSKTTSATSAIVTEARREDLSSFASSIGSPFVRGSGFAPNAPTAVITWDANGSTTGASWTTDLNWNPDTVPGSGDTATFATPAGAASITINFGPGTNNGVANQIVGAIALTGGESKSIGAATATPGTLTINGVGGVLLSNSSSSFDLTLQNGASIMTVALPNSGSIEVTNSARNITISSSVTGAAGITKTGAGTLILSGSNLYSGGTTVDGGTLLVNNTVGSGTGSGVINVNNSGTTLGGTGTILAGSNNVTINTGANIAGGTDGSVGTLTLTTNALVISGTYLNDINGATADRITLSGNLVLNAGATLDFSVINAPTAPIYNLVTYTGTLSGTFIEVGTPAGYDVIYNAQSIDLVAIPEPGTWIGAALALAAIGFTQRRRLRGLVALRA
jgi:autotransporter-associated beta strand protein